MRAIDEHTKLARAAVEFPPILDELFKVNVTKMKVSLPSDLKTPIERSINELVAAAQARYRRGELTSKSQSGARGGSGLPELGIVGLAIRAAAVEAGETKALGRIEERLRARASEIADAVGWTD